MSCKIYKIVNEREPDVVLYIGGTSQKYLPARWHFHKRMVADGVDRLLYNHMRTVPGPYKMVMLSTCEKDVLRQHEQTAIDLHRPPLNQNRAHHMAALLPLEPQPKREKKQLDMTNPAVVKIHEYQKTYQLNYQKRYYEAKKEHLLERAKAFNTLNNERVRQQRKEQTQLVMDSKRYYCDSCDRAFRNPSAQEAHNKTARHIIMFG